MSAGEREPGDRAKCHSVSTGTITPILVYPESLYFGPSLRTLYFVPYRRGSVELTSVRSRGDKSRPHSECSLSGQFQYPDLRQHERTVKTRCEQGNSDRDDDGLAWLRSDWPTPCAPRSPTNDNLQASPEPGERFPAASRSVTRAAMPGVRGFSTLRARSYVFRLPLFTRAIILVIVLFWALTLPSAWDVRRWGALIPDQVSFTTGRSRSTTRPPVEAGCADGVYKAYRLSTFPLVHLNFIHAALNVVALTPLMERFESEYGTLTTLALFFGREKETALLFEDEPSD